MVTKLTKDPRREIAVARQAWIVTITPSGLKLTRKGKREGIELACKDLLSGDASLAVSLNATLALPEPNGVPAAAPSRARSSKEGNVMVAMNRNATVNIRAWLEQREILELKSLARTLTALYGIGTFTDTIRASAP